MEEKSKVKCSDRNCPLHGRLRVRGRTFKGTVKRIVGNRAAIELERLIYSKKYERYAKAKTKLHAHIPACLAGQIAVGSTVKIGKCRPLSKIIHFVVLSRIK